MINVDYQSFEFASVYPNLLTGKIRQQDEDFVVNEIPSFLPSGSGEHVWLKLQKQNANTDWVAGQLAHIANVNKKDVGYAGLKDRHAVTTQWFSVYLPGKPAPAWQAALPDEVTVLEENRHNRKLRTGALQGNEFNILIKECSGDRKSLEERINAIQGSGIPNYFGEQRFGRDFANLRRANEWFDGQFSPKNRNLKSLLLSSARSWIFNRILHERIQQRAFHRLMEGDVFQLAGSNSWFYEPLNDVLLERFQQGDLHATATLWGEGELASQHKVAELELQIANIHPLFMKGLAQHRLKQERRSIRVIPQNLSYEWKNNDELSLKFCMPAGCYATALLKEVVKY